MKEVYRLYKSNNDDVPVMLLGLKRDLRGVGTGWVDPLEVSFWIWGDRVGLIGTGI